MMIYLFYGFSVVTKVVINLDPRNLWIDLRNPVFKNFRHALWRLLIKPPVEIVAVFVVYKKIEKLENFKI